MWFGIPWWNSLDSDAKKKKKKNVQRARFKTFFLDYTASFINKMPFPDWSMTAYSAIQLRLKLCYVSSEIARLILFGSNWGEASILQDT